MGWLYGRCMSVAVRKLNVEVGQVVEVDGRRYDVVADREGGIALEPAITKTVAEMLAGHGEVAVSREELTRQFGAPLPPDGEG